MITITPYLFYIFSTIAVIAAIMVILANNPVRAILSLIVCFIATAVLWLLLQAEFLAVILVLVYVGAVMVLFLFVVMMLNIDFAVKRARFSNYLLLGLLAGIALFIGLWVNINIANGHDLLVQINHDYHNTQRLGLSLFSDYLYPLEVAGMLLLVAIIAAISLSFRGKRRGAKQQDISAQLSATKASRLKMAHVSPESKL